MIRLQKLVLRNFKSFQKAEIPLSSGFTVIVGSNGSGKTNILDAILFALGTSSIKSLRAGRIQELVNNSAQESYAKVELTLKAKDTTYLVQRMIDKQGKSVYRLNDRRKTRDEISALLLELGIKPTGHNIVAQGDVTRIIEMSPEERRQIIDELAGLQEFDEKKEEAMKELQKVEEKLKGAGIVLSEREHYLEQLQRDMEAAAQFKDLQEERERLRATIIFNEMQEIGKAQSESRAKIEKISLEKEKLQSESDGQAKQENELREKAADLNQKILSASEKTYATIGSRLEEAKSGSAGLQERIENKKQMLERNYALISELRLEIGAIESEAGGLQQRINKIDSELPQLQAQMGEFNNRKSALEQKQLGGEEKIRRLHSEEEAVSAELRGLSEEKYKLLGALQGAKKEQELQQQALKQLDARRQQLRARLDEKEKSSGLLLALRKKFPGRIKQLLAAAEKDAEELLGEEKELGAEQRNLRESIAALQKSYALCPVCESRIETGKRDSLLKKKDAALRQFLEGEKAVSERRRGLEAKKTELRAALDKETELGAETAGLDEIAGELGGVQQQLQKAKEKIGGREIDALEAAARKIEAGVKEKEAVLLGQRQRRREFSDSVSLGNLQKISNRLMQLQAEAQALEIGRENAEARIGELLGRRRKESEAGIEALEKERREIAGVISKSEDALQEANKRIGELEEKLGSAEKENKALMHEKFGLEEKIGKLAGKAKDAQYRLRQLDQQENLLKIDLGKQDVRLADLQDEFKQVENLERITGVAGRELRERLAAAEKKLSEIGPVNMKAIDSFNQLQAEVKDIRQKVELLEKERLAVLDMAEKIEVKRTGIFTKCFEELGKNFSEMFYSLFGGEGRLSLTVPDKPLESGLMIEAKHKGSSIKNIDSMSGGEKTLTALAFLFAIQLYEPAPFYIFDEADAALDKENSEKVANLIKGVSKKGQFIAITHNDPLIQKADQIIGVALNKQKSSVIGLQLKEQLDLGQNNGKKPE
ncbi:MAG: AAA family ATPase [Candidatus Diapherotrites archaeon]|nr:AAA family ATPase [Candidatus Diapherotrites archaeon]